MKPSDQFHKLTSRHCLYNITLIQNIPSIMELGILCFNDVKQIDHISIAMDNVQGRRNTTILPNGEPLHSYANLYFDYNNAMLYKRKDRAEEICILALSSEVLDLDNCVIADRNASTAIVKFYSSDEGLQYLDYKRIYAQYWNHPDDPFETRNHKAIKCAEVLIPHCIPYYFVLGAYVVSASAKKKLEEVGFDKKIIVKPKAFYR